MYTGEAVAKYNKKTERVRPTKKKPPTEVINITEPIITNNENNIIEELEEDKLETYVENDPEQPIVMHNTGTKCR